MFYILGYPQSYSAEGHGNLQGKQLVIESPWAVIVLLNDSRGNLLGFFVFSVCLYLFLSYLCLWQLVSFPYSYLSQKTSSHYVVVCGINTHINKIMCFAFKLVLLCG